MMMTMAMMLVLTLMIDDADDGRTDGWMHG